MVVLTVLFSLLLAVSCEARRFYDTSLPIISEVAFQQEPTSKSTHASQAFVGSPSYLQSGPDHYLASHDRFFDAAVGVAYVYFSHNQVDWQPVANITPMYWAQLFMVNGTTYISGTSGDTLGDWVISKCQTKPCDGKAWTTPTVLFPKTATTGYHCAPTPVVKVQNTLFRAMEAWDKSQSGEFGVTVISVDAACNLLQPSCWRMSNSLYMKPGWVNMTKFTSNAWEESNIIDDKDGNLFVMVRLDQPLDGCLTLETCNRAALCSFDPLANTVSFKQIVQFPSSCNKFAIKRGPDNRFYSLTNPVTKAPIANYGNHGCLQRNNVVLTVSDDLIHWHVCATVLYDDTGLAMNDSFIYTGLQYIDWSFDGNDIVAAVRSAYRGAVSAHDANRLLIANVSNYQQRCL
eukprot:m.211633 g.211633  ORF g.211633 m.211633 type:complete len:403 (-) comp17151_c0_seq13:2774-3982(-)